MGLTPGLSRTGVYARLLPGAGHGGFSGDVAEATASLHEAVTIAREAGDALALGTALFYYSQVLWQTGQLAPAREIASEGLLVSRALDHHTLQGQCEYVLGAVHYELGEYGPSRTRQEEALRLYKLGGDVSVGLQ